MSHPTADQPGYEIDFLELGPMENMINLVSDKQTGKAAIVDPAWDADAIFELAEQKGVTITDIILTHCHPDHINRVDVVLEKTNAQIHISREEYEFWKLNYPNPHFVKEGDIIKLGNTDIEVLFTPGHSIGHVCFKIDKDLITGDTLFIYGCGHCKLPGANPKQLFESLQRLKTLPGDIVIHPAHHYAEVTTSTMQEQVEGNPFLHFDDVEKFVEYREVIHDQIREYPLGPISKDEL